MKKETKIVISMFSVIGWLFVISIGYFIYVISWKETDIGTYTFGDTEYELRICEIGEADWPFGYAHCRMDFKNGKELVSSVKVDIDNNGAPAHSGNFRVHWFENFIRVVVTKRGGISLLYDLYYDGTIEKTDYRLLSNSEPTRQYSVDETDAGNTPRDKIAGILDLELPPDTSAGYTDSYGPKKRSSKDIRMGADFYGDGRKAVQEQIEAKGTWHELPMPEDFRALTELVGDGWCGDTDEDIGDGYWFFLDRHKDAAGRGDPHAAIQREELDFIAAVYSERYGALELFIYKS